MEIKLKPERMRTCECCGGAVGEYRAEFFFQVWKEVRVEAPNEEAAARMLCDIADNVETPVPEGWRYGSLIVCDNDGDQFYER